MSDHKTYALENKPDFVDGQPVKVDMAHFGLNLGVLEGEIVGKSTINIIDYWMVKFANPFPSYPFKVVNVPHVAIIQE